MQLQGIQLEHTSSPVWFHASVRRVVGVISTCEAFPDICVKSKKRFRYGNELFQAGCVGAPALEAAIGATKSFWPHHAIELKRLTGRALTNARTVQEAQMNHSIYSADRGTHLKIVAVALLSVSLWPGLDGHRATGAAMAMPLKRASRRPGNQSR
jgi:hypothetical protein